MFAPVSDGRGQLTGERVNARGAAWLAVGPAISDKGETMRRHMEYADWMDMATDLLLTSNTELAGDAPNVELAVARRQGAEAALAMAKEQRLFEVTELNQDKEARMREKHQAALDRAKQRADAAALRKASKSRSA